MQDQVGLRPCGISRRKFLVISQHPWDRPTDAGRHDGSWRRATIELQFCKECSNLRVSVVNDTHRTRVHSRVMRRGEMVDGNMTKVMTIYDKDKMGKR